MKTDTNALFARADAIRERRANGFWMPILWHLALKRHGLSLLILADWYTQSGKFEEMGAMSDAFSPLGMMYRAYRLKEPFAATHTAISYFNVGDMQRYRHWLARAARNGDEGAQKELSIFETRKPHRLARRLRRLRPYRKDGS